jgi:hypothetical protein
VAKTREYIKKGFWKSYLEKRRIIFEKYNLKGK